MKPAESTVSLLRRYRSGEERALEILLAKNMEPLRRWARGRLPGGSRGSLDTVDLVQETILKAIPQLERFESRHEGALQAYLRRAVMNRIRNEYRRVSRVPDHAPLDSRVVDRGESPLDQAVGQQVVEDYEQALAKLDESDQQAIILRLELDFSYQEIADATDRPTADAARMAVARALLKLTEVMRHER